MTNITFVDDQDNVIGAGPREEAIEKGIRHRISRVILVNSAGEVLLTRRALHLSSGPGKWSVSAAGHVDDGETYEQAALREMEEEIGVVGIELSEVGYFYADATDTQGARQFSRIYTARYDGEIYPNEEEVMEAKWITKAALDEWIADRSEEFTSGGLKSIKYVRKLL